MRCSMWLVVVLSYTYQKQPHLKIFYSFTLFVQFWNIYIYIYIYMKNVAERFGYKKWTIFEDISCISYHCHLIRACFHFCFVITVMLYVMPIPRTSKSWLPYLFGLIQTITWTKEFILVPSKVNAYIATISEGSSKFHKSIYFHLRCQGTH
jgi:hypothetical protein